MTIAKERIMKNKFKLYTASVLALALIAGLLRTYCALSLYDSTVGYWDAHPIATVLSCITVTGLLGCIVGAILTAPSYTASPKSQAILYALAGAACFFGGLYHFGAVKTGTLLTDIAIGILSIATAAFFFLLCTPDTTKSASLFSKLRPWLYMVPILLSLVLLVSAYFDMTATINGPFSTPFIFTMLAGAMFFLMEMRNEIGRGLPRMHAMAASIAILLSVSTGMSQLAFSLLGDAGNAVTIANPARAVLALAIAPCAIARLLSFCRKNDTADE